MKIIIICLAFMSLVSSCNKRDVFDGTNSYQDGFEIYTSVNELILPYPKTNDMWSFTQITNSDNVFSLDSLKAHTGKKSLKFMAKKSDENLVSKCSIAKQKMAFWAGETMRVSAWYYLEGTQKLDWLFLLDLEEQTAIGAGPGMRLTLVDNQLRVEYKFNEKDIVQNVSPAVNFPRNQWVELIWEVKLSQKHGGSVKLWQNGQLIIESQYNKTLPTDILYFQQGTKGMYSSIEIGITANSPDNDLILWMDDVKFEKVNLQ